MDHVGLTLWEKYQFFWENHFWAQNDEILDCKLSLFFFNAFCSTHHVKRETPRVKRCGDHDFQVFWSKRSFQLFIDRIDNVMSSSIYHSGPDINDLLLLIYSLNESVFFKMCHDVPQISGEHWRYSQWPVGPQDSFLASSTEIVPSSLIITGMIFHWPLACVAGAWK